MTEFLKKNRDEVKSVSIFEYDEEEHMRLERAENWEEGHRVGIEQGIQQGTLLTKKIFKLHINGKSDMEIAELCEVPIEKVVETLS